MLNQEEVSRPPSAPSAALGTRWRGFAEEARLHLRLAVPIALAQFGMIALSLVDTAFVGRVSTVDLAAVALGRSIVFALSSLCLGAASA
ncbi:MAG: hypothetical protein JOZ69_05615, partial [Myxococcales bacterium]|nr:hypothetical protein [Myxococcales bacterium]